MTSKEKYFLVKLAATYEEPVSDGQQAQMGSDTNFEGSPNVIENNSFNIFGNKPFLPRTLPSMGGYQPNMLGGIQNPVVPSFAQRTAPGGGVGSTPK